MIAISTWVEFAHSGRIFKGSKEERMVFPRRKEAQETGADEWRTRSERKEQKERTRKEKVLKLGLKLWKRKSVNIMHPPRKKQKKQSLV